MNMPDILDVDLFQILSDRYGTSFNRHEKKNVIGWSALPYGMRKIALRKIHRIPSTMDMKKLMGQLMNHVLQDPDALAMVVSAILNQTDLEVQNITVIPEEKLKHEINGGQFLSVQDAKIIEGHIDTYTSLFSWELKTTWINYAKWSREIAPHYAVQLNGYLGSKQQEWGVVSCINMLGFKNTFHSFKESSEKWTYNIPIFFSQKQFDLSIQKAILVFKAIDDGEANLECPVFEWECPCDAVEKCGKIPIRCSYVDNLNKRCTKVMFEWEDCLTDEFKEKPICKNCYENKTNKRKEYHKVKYNGKLYPYEVRYE